MNHSKELFAIVKEFSNPAATENDITPSQKLCDSLADFFHDKISPIYENLKHQPSAADRINQLTPTNTNPKHLLTHWDLLTRKTLYPS